MDRLVISLCAAARDDFEACRQEDDGADPRPDLAEAYMTAAARLSAVLVAVRDLAAVWRDTDSGREDLREAADDLTRAIESADREVAP
jgi:hypothetical protein